MDKAEREQRFDGILFSLAEQHPQGVIDVRITKYFACHFYDEIFNLLNILAAANDRRLSRT